MFYYYKSYCHVSMATSADEGLVLKSSTLFCMKRRLKHTTCRAVSLPQTCSAYVHKRRTGLLKPFSTFRLQESLDGGGGGGGGETPGDLVYLLVCIQHTSCLYPQVYLAL